MPHPNYLYKKSGYFHFRRRIPGLSTCIAPVQVAMGTTDQKTALTWIRTLTTEFETVLDSYLYVSDPIPEDLIAQFMRVRIQLTAERLRRDFRMERMSSRSKTLVASRPIMSAVLDSLLIDGVQGALPASRINPAWSTVELEAAVRLYDTEVRSLQSQEFCDRLFTEFEHVTGVKALSKEHQYQILEAYLHAKKAALDAGEDEQEIRSKVFAARAKALLQAGLEPMAATTQTDFQMTSASAQVSPVKTALSPSPTVLPPPPLTDSTSDDALPRYTAGVAEIKGALTYNTLNDQQQQAEMVAKTRPATPTGADISSVFWRMAIVDNLTEEVISQRLGSLRLFSLITGLQCADEIRQHHLSGFRDAMATFPNTYMRSRYDTDKSYDQIMHGVRALPEKPMYLSHATRKRHIKTIELLLERAASEGHRLDPDLNISKVKLKSKEKRAKHKGRSVFKFDEMQSTFSHSLWQGAKSAGRRHDPGQVVAQDCKYWIPLILAYTGARRAEIAGLLSTDIQLRDDHQCIVIQANKYRGIKGEDPGEMEEELKKTRIVPIHPHLIELGFLDYAERINRSGSDLLFPDVVPKPKKGSARAQVADPALMVDKFGASIDYDWRKAVKCSLNGNPRKLCMHSLRHYVNDFFLFSTDVLAPVRIDIVGHVKAEAENTNTDVYRGDAPVRLMCSGSDVI